MQSEKLIQQLIEQTQQLTAKVEQLKKYNIQSLSWKENPNTWSILECIEHLNLYGYFYLPQIEQKIKESKSLIKLEFH